MGQGQGRAGSAPTPPHTHTPKGTRPWVESTVVRGASGAVGPEASCLPLKDRFSQGRGNGM